MFKVIILLSLSLNLAFAKTRFTESEKKEFFQDMRDGVANIKEEAKSDKIKGENLKTDFEELLYGLQNAEKITPAEFDELNKKGELFLKNANQNSLENDYYKFIEEQVSILDKKPLEKIKEDQVCNNWSCDQGLVCAMSPKEELSKSCKSGRLECKENKDCCSNKCSSNPGVKKKFCESVARCFRPLNLGQSCQKNPVCIVGQCLPFNSQTSGIGECSIKGNSCKKNSDCCSNSCNNNKCVESYVCKDCVKNGSRAIGGKKCCEGLYLNDLGTCVPDMPPVQIPQVRIHFFKGIFNSVVGLFMASANAGSLDGYYKELANTEEAIKAANKRYGEAKNAGKDLEAFKIDDERNSLAHQRDQIYEQIRDIEKYEEKLKNDEIKSSHSNSNIQIAGLENSANNAKIDRDNYEKAKADGASKEELAKLKAKSDQSEFLANKGFLQAEQLDDAEEHGSNHPETVEYKIKNSVDKKDYKPLLANLNMVQKSNFKTCDIRLRDDLFLMLKTTPADIADKVNGKIKEGATTLHDLESAMLAFDYMFLSEEGINDYWMSTPGNARTSMYGRLKEVAKEHHKIRSETNLRIDKMNDRLTCMCLDAQGAANIKDPKKQEFWKSSCDEHKATEQSVTCFKRVSCSELDSKKADGKSNKYEETFDKSFACVKGMTTVSCDPKKDQECSCKNNAGSLANEGSSGLKGTKLLVSWTKALQEFNAELSVDNTETYKKIAQVRDWVEKVEWDKTETKSYVLFNYVIRVKSNLFAFVAILTVGLVGLALIMATAGSAGGAGIGAAGVLASMLLLVQNGAWYSVKPKISDEQISKRRCDKVYKCKTYTRRLIQPYNKICDKNFASNACVKNVVFVKDFKMHDEPQSVYLVDPWIPYGVNKNNVFTSNATRRNYAEKLESDFQNALSFMQTLSPGTTKDTGYENNQAFLNDERILFRYFPNEDYQTDQYQLTNQAINEIKEGAKKFAIAEQFLNPADQKNLEAFAEYAFNFHFVYPKQAHPESIGYPTVGLLNYLDYMSNGVAASLGVGTGDASKTFAHLNAKHLEDYLKKLELYIDPAVAQSDKAGIKFAMQEIDSVKAELDEMNGFIAAINNPNYDSKSNDSSFKSSQSKTSGAKGTLSPGQQRFAQAIRTLRDARKNQLKKLETYKKAMAKSNDKDRMNKMSLASSRFSKSFSNNKLGSMGGMFGSSSHSNGSTGIGDGFSGKSSDGNDDKDSKKNGNGAGQDFLGLGGSQVGGLGGFSDSMGGKSSGSKNGDDSEGSNSDSNSSGVNGNGMSEEDRRKLAEAIEARDRANKNKYSSENDDQTLFEKVTNAYIRNYDKVLSKKKDKDLGDKK